MVSVVELYLGYFLAPLWSNFGSVLALEMRFWIRIQTDPKSRFRSQLRVEVVGVIGMFYSRQKSVQTVYFASVMMGVVGMTDFGAFQFQIQPTAKSATASL